MLRISTKGRYAARILVYLALHEDSAPSPKQEIADAEGISADYVEQILTKLRSGGLVRSHRGARGGFSLARAPGAITMADVLAASEGPIELVPCEGEECPRTSMCVTRMVWHEASRALD